MTVSLIELKDFLDSYLYFDKKIKTSVFDPYMSNGLMLEGKDSVKKIGFGVSASISLFEKAKMSKCDALIVHHSFNYPVTNKNDIIFQKRYSYLVKNNISLFGYHFFLDAHPEVGNNVQILKQIDVKPLKPYLFHGNSWGWIGELDKGRDFDLIYEKCKSFFSKRTIIYNFGPKKIKRIVVVSGGGAPSSHAMQELIDEGIDLYITGEAHEWNRELFRESKINFIAGGHYATEVFGVKALMERVKRSFKNIETEWIDLINEV